MLFNAIRCVCMRNDDTQQSTFIILIIIYFFFFILQKIAHNSSINATHSKTYSFYLLNERTPSCIHFILVWNSSCYVVFTYFLASAAWLVLSPLCKTMLDKCSDFIVCCIMTKMHWAGAIESPVNVGTKEFCVDGGGGCVEKNPDDRNIRHGILVYLMVRKWFSDRSLAKRTRFLFCIWHFRLNCSCFWCGLSLFG